MMIEHPVGGHGQWLEQSRRARFEVKPYEKIFGLYLDGELIGTSKLHCDCDASREAILRAWAK